MKTKQGGGILFVEIILFFCILFTHTVMASDGISTIMTYNTNTNEQELSTSKYNIYYAKNYLECEGVEGELVGSSRMNYVKPKGSISGKKYNHSNGYYAECRIIEFEKIYTLDNISEIVTETNTPIGTKLTFEYSLNGIDWKSLGYTTTKYCATQNVNNREVNFIKGKDLHSSDEFKYLRATTTTMVLDIFDVYLNKCDKVDIEPCRKLGVEYEQIVDIENSTKSPKISSVKYELVNNSSNTYILSVEKYEVEDNGIPFFVWEADGAMFTQTNEDYTKVQCVIDDGIYGRKIPIKLYMGDGLGHITTSIVWLETK